MRIFVVNPGSTSTKIALIENDSTIFLENISHDVEELKQFRDFTDQFDYRVGSIRRMVNEHHLDMETVDVFAGRGGGLFPTEGGVYVIDDLLLRHSYEGVNGVRHPALLGPKIADAFAKIYGKPAYVVNPPDVDELQDVARVTGVKGIYRTIHLHALNLKETAIRHAQLSGKDYKDLRLIVCHLGGGISVSAHRNGKMIDGNDIAGGEGPMAPTRCGGMSVTTLLKCMEEKTPAEVKALCVKDGGFMSHFGTSDALEVFQRGQQGDRMARLVWDAMIYQITKEIGAMAAVLEGDVDGILLGGGLAHNDDLTEKIRSACGWIAPVSIYPGEFEMEAMAAGAMRVLRGEEEAKRYTGKPVWEGFDF